MEESALVQSVARVQVEGEVEDGGCEGEAAELSMLLVLVDRDGIGSGEAHEAGCEAHGVYARRQGLCGLQSQVLELLMRLVRLIDVRAQLPKRDRRGLGIGDLGWRV